MFLYDKDMERVMQAKKREVVAELQATKDRLERELSSMVYNVLTKYHNLHHEFSSVMSGLDGINDTVNEALGSVANITDIRDEIARINSAIDRQTVVNERELDLDDGYYCCAVDRDPFEEGVKYDIAEMIMTGEIQWSVPIEGEDDPSAVLSLIAPYEVDITKLCKEIGAGTHKTRTLTGILYVRDAGGELLSPAFFVIDIEIYKYPFNANKVAEIAGCPHDNTLEATEIAIHVNSVKVYVNNAWESASSLNTSVRTILHREITEK